MLLDLSRLFPNAGVPTDESRSLSLLAEWLADFNPRLLFLAQRDGQLTAVELFGHAALQDEAYRLSQLLNSKLQTQRFCSFAYNIAGELFTAFGLRLPFETLGAILGGILLGGDDVPKRLQQLQGALLMAGRLAWAVIEKDHELKRMVARKHQLLGELESLRRAHAETLALVHREQEKRLLAEQEYARRLEAEVAARSAALEEAAADARRQSEQLRTYSLALEQALAAHEQLTEAAEAASRAKSEFLANISHEVRTPLTAILGHVDLMAEQLKPGTSTSHSLEVIRRNSRYLLTILNDLLDLAKVEAGKLRVEKVRCSPGEIVANLRELMDVRAREKGLPLLVETARLPATIVTDPVRVKQILLNLVGNAIKFTDVGHVRLRATFNPSDDRQGTLIFEVIDTGIGIDPQDLERLFEPFEQGSIAIEKKVGGTGLGLAICKRLSVLLDGEISVESQPGKGSTFRVKLPVEYSDELPEDEKPQYEYSAGVKSLHGRILLVEDAMDSRLLIQTILERAGAEVLTATTGREAVELILGHAAARCQREKPPTARRSVDPQPSARTTSSRLNDPKGLSNEGKPPYESSAGFGLEGEDIHDSLSDLCALHEEWHSGADEQIPDRASPVSVFDLVLMDIQLPEMDGIKATEYLRNHGYTGTIIALTASGEFEERSRYEKAGFDGFLAKPIDRHHLVNEVSRYLTAKAAV